MKKESNTRAIFIWLSMAFTFLAVVTGNLFDRKSEFQIGSVVPTDFFAPFKFENTKLTEHNKQLAANSVDDIYMIDEQVLQNILSDTESLFNYTEEIIAMMQYPPLEIPDSVQKQLRINYIATNINYSQILQQKSHLSLVNSQYEMLLNIPPETLAQIEERILALFKQIYNNKGVSTEDLEKLDINSMILEFGISPVYQTLVNNIIDNQLVTNLVLDKDATEEARHIKRSSVPAVMVEEGEKIIGKGNKITEESYQLLIDSGIIGTNNIDNFVPYIGIFIMILILYVFVISFLRVTAFKSFLTPEGQNLLFVLYIMMLIVARLMLGLQFIQFPLAIGAMIIALLLNKEIACVFHFVILVVYSLMYKADMTTILYQFITGIMSVFIIVKMIERKDMIKVAGFLGIIYGSVYIAMVLLIDMPLTINLAYNMLIAVGIGVFSVILVGGSLPLWESAFHFVTRFQLLELTNPNQPILKRLLLEATGTYHHSLLVGNLAETAADEIGANALLARVGGYYHDIGKLTCGNYFKENQGSRNPHDSLDPRSSANIIISHVTTGVEIAAKYNLPECVKDMILQHHGCSVMQYFYIKAQNTGTENIKEEDFTYPGPRPQTKEAALVMLADIIEATTRSMQNKLGPDFTIEDLVRKMVKQQLDIGELSECNLFLSDIEKIIQSFTRTLNAMYHERIEYPEKKEKK
ncbi:HD family phosphohydrolase [Candidatus Epulonipiscium viviparus]|uniref:HD family phosphohydrolase n=1 Tax=Candidatus Epulonipiscium viviparus TaxID=420336 RepID=UPI0004951854|nr:HDIG domain-containing metalloprotein [Candidatus Epulopiscium viviparus]